MYICHFYWCYSSHTKIFSHFYLLNVIFSLHLYRKLVSFFWIVSLIMMWVCMHVHNVLFISAVQVNFEFQWNYENIRWELNGACVFFSNTSGFLEIEKAHNTINLISLSNCFYRSFYLPTKANQSLLISIRFFQTYKQTSLHFELE